VASDQTVPGSTGGSVHVLEVAQGLAARGHDVHAVIRADRAQPAEETRAGVRWHRIRWFPFHRAFRFRAAHKVAAIAERIAPDVVMERYYNFGGEGIRVAAERHCPSLLEVNSPVIDHSGSLKALLDRALLVQPMKAYRESLCRQARALVSPLLEIVPAFAREKTRLVTWGANAEAFHPPVDRAHARRAWSLPDEAVVVIFSGSFRPWHGVHILAAAARRLAHRADIFFVLAGGEQAGPGEGFRGCRLGPIPYNRMPDLLAAADIGVAPYDTRKLGQLRLGFYWSPLKIFEYMATGLPTLTIPRPPLTEIVRDGEEGLHFREADAADLARAIERLADDPALRRRLGTAARERVVTRYSWKRHCEQLEAVLTEMRR
jgi:glycosyltransferase involved in cell wall biosynthesis